MCLFWISIPAHIPEKLWLDLDYLRLGPLPLLHFFLLLHYKKGKDVRIVKTATSHMEYLTISAI